MNIKIAGNAITFKITEEELNALLSGAPLEEEVALGANRFSIAISTVPRPSSEGPQTFVALSSDAAHARFTLHTTMDEIKKLSDMGKNRDGLSVRDGDLDIALQVDIRKDSRERKRA